MGQKHILFIQLGSPASPAVGKVRAFLTEFLKDPRVVDLPKWLWYPILYLFVLPLRPFRSAALYRHIWSGKGFPLVELTQSMAQKIQAELANEEIRVWYAFLLGSKPSLKQVLAQWENERLSQSSDDYFLVVPLFPQYSESTVASVYDLLAKAFKSRVHIPNLFFLNQFHRSRAFIDQSVERIAQFIQQKNETGNPIELLVLSFHGLPKRRVVVKQDSYYRHSYESFVLLRRQLLAHPKVQLRADQICMTFQSRFGSEEWLTPYTDEFVLAQVGAGVKQLAVYCPAFVTDCLETVDEIGRELKHEVEAIGGNLELIPCLNDDLNWCRDFTQYLQAKWSRPLANGSDDIEYQLTKEETMDLPKQELSSQPLSTDAKRVLKIVFLTLFLDLVGFSIIFPLFPALAKYYLEVDRDNYFLSLIFDSISSLTQVGGQDINSIVLFGGALGALYSLLQFIAAPLWGGLSDRIGRRPVLLISVMGLGLSYLLWVFSGNFTMLILARFIGGIMGGNISVATATVADITDSSNRSKGMAIIGIAFALGFIIGPAMGGIFAMWDPSQWSPRLEALGVNPFSLPALLAFILSAFNLFYIWKSLPETLPAEKRGQASAHRSVNPLRLFRPLPYPGVNLTNLGYFLFLLAFSGMEFTLTFLAVERLAFTPLENGYMFIFIGFLIAMVQGGYVRRKAHQVGEKRMALQGLVTLIPGLVLIAQANTGLLLYAGLFFLSIGSAMVIPCLTTLVSLYTPASEQGKSVGIFRSLGALARVFGPMIAALLYWRYGSHVPYTAGAAFLVLPILLVAKLPKLSK